MTLSATVFEILTLKARKSLNFPDPLFFEAPFGGNPLEFGNEIWRQKTTILGLPDGEQIVPLAFFVLTQYWRVTDGQMDGQTDGQTRCDPITRASIASRGVKKVSLRMVTHGTLEMTLLSVNRAAAGTRVPDGYPGNKLPG